MQNLAHWLEELGMSEYTQGFAENRIDLSVLPELTDRHLKARPARLHDYLALKAVVIDDYPAATGAASWPKLRSWVASLRIRDERPVGSRPLR